MENMWGGIFDKKANKSVHEYTSSIGIDKILGIYDAKYSIAHAKALEVAGILTKKETKDITKSLDELIKKLKSGKTKISLDVEDIHTFIENFLHEDIGDAALKLHSGRSRNDQIMVSVRLYCKDAIMLIMDKLSNFSLVLLDLAQSNKDVIIPSYTHLQHAQPVLFAHYVLAYVNMFKRDIERMDDSLARIDVLPSGSAACSGTSIDLDLSLIAEELEFLNIADNSLDAVSDRDFVTEILSALSIMFMHLSRLSEDLILWYSKEFSLISIDESYCTGSSIMPHKKNPDILEIVRGNTAKIYGDMVSIFTLLKGLPLSYNKDLQLDKEFLFNSLTTSSKTLDVLIPLVKSIKVNSKKASSLLKDDSLYITDVAEWLTQKGLAFRKAHKILGQISKHCIKNNVSFTKLSLDKLKEFSPIFDKEVFKLFNPKESVKRKKTDNSTNPDLVLKKIKKLRKEFS